jgi:hypothetical protein
MPSINLHTPELRSVQALVGLDLTLARRLVLKCESSASSGRAWALILSRRLQDTKPISDAAREVACRIADEIELCARDLKELAEKLACTLGRSD